MGQLVRSLLVSRQAKEVFKTLQKVTVSFNPFDESATTAREFVRRVRTPPVRASNSKMKVDVTILEEHGNPTIDLTYVDGHQQKITSKDLKITEIIDEIERVARWKGGAVNPFHGLRSKRAKGLGLE